MDVIKLVSDSPKSNYLISEKSNNVVIHFNSDVEINDLREYVYISLSQYSNFFFMLECNNKTMMAMSKENLQHLIDLGDNVSDNVIINFRDILDNIPEDELDSDNMEDSDITALKLMGSVKKNSKLPTLNEILDKISETGVESLNNLEIEILKSYSKN